MRSIDIVDTTTHVIMQDIVERKINVVYLMSHTVFMSIDYVGESLYSCCLYFY